MQKSEDKIIFCDLDNTLIPFDSTNRVIANNRKKLSYPKKYFKVKNIANAFLNYIKAKFGFTTRSVLFFQNENKSLIGRLIEDEFKDNISFNLNALNIIKNYNNIILLTGAPVEIANVILNKLPQDIKKKIEVKGMRLEEKNGKYTGKVLEHPEHLPKN